MGHVLAAITWDPQIRGVLIVLTGVTVLCGSVYLLLMTNVGARVGFLLAAAAVTGWATILATVWVLFPLGIQGRIPVWNTQEVLVSQPGDPATSLGARSAINAMQSFPQGWKQLHTGDKELGDAQSAADKILAQPAITSATAATGGTGKNNSGFQPVFAKNTDYVQLAGFDRGGQLYFFTLRHKTHYAVVQVQKALPQQPGQSLKPDRTQPIYTVVMVRDLGSLRLPAFVLACVCFVLFSICAISLHLRDREAMAARGIDRSPTPA